MIGETKLSDIRKNFSITFFGTFFGKISGFALKFVVAKVLGVEVLGIYFLLNLVISYYSYFFLGSSDILPREIPQLQVKKDDETIKKMRSIINLFSIFITLSLSTIFIIYILFFHDEEISKFGNLNLVLIFLTAVLSQFTKLITKHIKSIGIFSKLYINEAAMKIISPLAAIFFIVQYGLNGYLFSNLLFIFLNLSNFIYYNYKNKLNLLQLGYFNFNALIKNIKLGISMFINQNFNKGLFVILITYIGVKFSAKTVGEIGFIVMMLDVIKPLFKPYFSSVERKIYLTKESAKDKLNDLLNISIVNTLLFGITIQAFAIFLKYIIPIFFEEFIHSIELIPILSLLFFIRNSIIIINFYLNSYRLYLNRNILSIILVLLFILIAKLPFFTIDVTYLLTLFIVAITIYKIGIHLFAIKIFKNIIPTIKLIIFDLTATIIVFLSTITIIKDQSSPLGDIGIFLLCSVLLFVLYLKTPKKFLKQMTAFFN